MKKWNAISEVGLPPPERQYEEFFCWCPGLDKVVVLMLFVNEDRIGFCNDGGAWPEVTHWRDIEYPEPPKDDEGGSDEREVELRP